VRPGQPVSLQVEISDDGGGGSEGVEGAEQIAGETLGDQIAAADRAPDRLTSLEHDHVPAGFGEGVGRDQAVGSGPDDHSVHDGWVATHG
jgi:hypothetical protein